MLDEALDLDPVAREAWLAALPGDAAALAPTLRKLLARQASKETNDLPGLPVRFDLPGEADARPGFEPPTRSGRIACCARSATAAWARCGRRSAPTAR